MIVAGMFVIQSELETANAFVQKRVTTPVQYRDPTSQHDAHTVSVIIQGNPKTVCQRALTSHIL
ncbi:hypothetical protein GCM10007086_23980 [Photobacterium aphoticum]|nr:hypothetical protein GCM10007086_23980 [Photobacterium aphoticum]